MHGSIDNDVERARFGLNVPVLDQHDFYSVRAFRLDVDPEPANVDGICCDGWNIQNHVSNRQLDA